MSYFVYIIQSEKQGIYYKGFTENPQQRLIEHNSDKSRYTKNKGPWEMVFLNKVSTKREALIEEKRLKRLNTASIQQMIFSASNIIRKYF